MIESKLKSGDAIYRHVIPAGDPWTREIRKGQILRIVDLNGNQAADTLFYNAGDVQDRYSAQDTIRTQANIYLTTGTQLISSEGNVLLTIVADTCGRHDTLGGACATESNQVLTIVADTCGRHDTLGGACATESNQVRYAIEKGHMHACRQSFVKAALDSGLGMSKRDIASNINFFMNVPVTPQGGLTFADGVSAPGKYVELRAEMDVLAMISNCPQLNNPCNGYDPTPVEVLIWEAADV